MPAKASPMRCLRVWPTGEVCDLEVPKKGSWWDRTLIIEWRPSWLEA